MGNAAWSKHACNPARHYRWPGWLTRIREANLIRSMSCKGCSPHNAACEGFLGCS
ncbi:conserved hypothetical protein [Burkholderia cenocepacia HI2424]|uniref:Uncharacterized protein n=1 Tax=Burkholderia orbicola (strain AU 1054) TaxID=331271 RepID=A0A0H2XZU9_BURO1|nr:conserved hypothetical protein [Burkholderia cenocepacia HI2424]